MAKSIVIQSADKHIMGIAAVFCDGDDPDWPAYHDTDEARFATEIQRARSEGRHQDADAMRNRCGFDVWHGKGITTVVSAFLADLDYIRRTARMLLDSVSDAPGVQRVTLDCRLNIAPRFVRPSNGATVYLPGWQNAA